MAHANCRCRRRRSSSIVAAASCDLRMGGVALKLPLGAPPEGPEIVTVIAPAG